MHFANNSYGKLLESEEAQEQQNSRTAAAFS
jgi:hypothetical protein